MPSERKLRLSPTRIELYLFCPKAYHYYYVRKLRWGRLTPGHALGGALHRTLEAFHRAGPSEDVAALLERYSTTWTAKGYRDPAEEAEHFAAGEEMLRRYHEEAVRSERETVFVERTVSHEYPRYVLFGKIDRLDRLASGELEIVDYKSGRREVSEEDIRGSLALALYQLVVARKYPMEPVRASIYCLRTGATVSILRTAEELVELEDGFRTIAERILDEAEFAPTPGLHCAECAFQRICPASTTRRALGVEGESG
jgi:DNA helicase-2/ATP-dependent DNA helicase PcrA